MIGLVQALASLSGTAYAASDAARPVASFAVTTGATSVPSGWTDFCRRYPGECEKGGGAAQDIALTEAAWKTLDRINRSVNRSIAPVTDEEHWGVIDRWDYPTDGKGDCEDYALWKRKLLINAGYPASALLMTVVRDQDNEGHAVLTVRTGRGEFVLDNMTDSILPWDQTGYRFVKRQSQVDPNAWESIGPATAAPMYISTARRAQT